MPVFRAEYERLKKKQQKLEKLREELSGPNAFALAKDLNTRLKLVDATIGKKKKMNSAKLPPIEKSVEDIKEEVEPKAEESQEATEQVSETRPLEDESKQQTAKVEITSVEQKVDENLSLPPLQEKRNVSVATLNTNSNIPVTALLASNPVYQRMLQKEQEEREAELKRLEAEEEERKRKAEAAKPPPPLRETLFADMCLSKPKKFVRRRSPISGSILKRKRHAEQRMNFYKSQSKLHVERKLSNSINSLNKLANGTSETTSHKKVTRGFDNTETASTTTSSDDTGKVVRKKKRKEGDLILPPIKVDTDLLKELKEHRIKHKKESYGLPNLP
ncbi:gelsolin-related protein of 125 kDa-like [Ptychodera flava]|uniref:gelsolin-related protein of 125 kDa-like n=1 Tax=Ptychodera flava TaxID=63121 RepID=UPI003969C83E